MTIVRTYSLAVAAAAALAAGARAQEPAAPPSGSFVVRCGTLLLGDGGTALRDAWLVVIDGKVKSASNEAPPADLPVIDARTKVVMPGIVAVDSDLGIVADSDYQLTPDAMALDAFDFERAWTSALQGGVTTAYVSPGRARLVSGQGAVVKLAGQDLVARVLAESQCLRVNFAESALRAPRVFEPNPHPTDEEPLEPSRIQTPTGRISLLAELRAAFASATDDDKAPAGQGAAENRYDEQPLASVIAGKLPMRAGAFLANDIRRALLLQQELGVRMVLEDPQEIAEVAAQAAAQKVAATFRLPVQFGRGTPGGEDRLQKTPQPRPDAPAKAAAAGMTIGVGPAVGVPMRDYLMAPALAVRHGLSPSRALRAIGSDAAQILGVDARVGTLAAGKDADFVVLSGDPLAIGTMVEQTWIDGRRVYTRQTESRALAIRAGIVHDGTGNVLRSGTVLVQDGRIKSVGEELAIPYGAEVIDLPNGVMTPGLIDAYSHLGLAGEGMPVPGGSPGQRVHEAIVFDDPMFAAVVAEGITTVLVAGKDAAPVSGRISAIKTGATSTDAMVVKAIAGQRFLHEAIGPEGIKALADQIGRGKQYVEAWRKYEKDLAAWEAAQRGDAPPAAAPAPAPAATPPAEAPPPDPLSGTWEADVDIRGQVQVKIVLELKLEGTKVTGTIKLAIGSRELPAQPIAGGTFEGGKLTLQFRGMGGEATFEGTVQGDTMTGKLALGPMGDQDVTATRTSKASSSAPRRAPAAKPEESSKPKAPKVDENLEPLRAAIEKRAVLVVNVNRGAAIRDVVELLEKEQLAYALQGAEDLLDDPSPLGGKKPPVVLGPGTVTENKGVLKNAAAALADLDLPISFGSGECAGARHLPAHVAYSVRYGLSPADALAALTSWTAKAFRIDDRVGSLQRGRDADLVVFSGNPFEPQSQVLLVVCNGRVVVDNREGAK